MNAVLQEYATDPALAVSSTHIYLAPPVLLFPPASLFTSRAATGISKEAMARLAAAVLCTVLALQSLRAASAAVRSTGSFPLSPHRQRSLARLALARDARECTSGDEAQTAGDAPQPPPPRREREDEADFAVLSCFAVLHLPLAVRPARSSVPHTPGPASPRPDRTSKCSSSRSGMPTATRDTPSRRSAHSSRRKCHDSPCPAVLTPASTTAAMADADGAGICGAGQACSLTAVVLGQGRPRVEEQAKGRPRRL